MKIVLLFISVIESMPLFAQSDTVITYYNRKNEPCREEEASKFSLVTKESDHYKKVMADIKDNKIQYIEYFTDADCKNQDGPSRELYKTGKTRRTGSYFQNKKTGIWRTWTEDGKLVDSMVYRNDFITGLGLRWTNDGKVVDSLIFEDGGKGISHAYWPNGNKSHSGGYAGGKKDGEWTYYHRSGNKCQEVKYQADSALVYTCYDDQGNVQSKDCIYEQEANFPGGEKAWAKYLSEKLSAARLPNDYYKGKIYGQIWIQFIVDSDGSITDAKVTEELDPKLDAISLDIVRRSPRWNYAVQFNRPVKAYCLQPITFPKAQ